MGLSALHNVYAVAFGTLATPTVLRARDTSLLDGTQVIREANSGEPYARNAYITGQAPSGEFSTPAIATALAAIGPMGGALTAAAPLVLYAQKRTAGGTRATGSVHQSYTVAPGIVIPNRLSCDHGGIAQLSYSYAAVSTDGATEPVTISATAALADLPKTDDHFGLGAVTIGGSTLASKTNVSVDFGVRLTVSGSDGDIWPTIVTIEVVEALITIATLDMTLASIGLDGLAATHANTSIVFRKREVGGTFADDGHVTLTAAGLAVVNDRLRGAMGSPASGVVALHCTFDGTNSPIKLSA
jgi:hypothetical protein